MYWLVRLTRVYTILLKCLIINGKNLFVKTTWNVSTLTFTNTINFLGIASHLCEIQQYIRIWLYKTLIRLEINIHTSKTIHQTIQTHHTIHSNTIQAKRYRLILIFFSIVLYHAVSVYSPLMQSSDPVT